MTCCDNQRIMVDESFTYEAQFVDGKLFIDTTDCAMGGFENIRCVNCDKEADDDVELEW